MSASLASLPVELLGEVVDNLLLDSVPDGLFHFRALRLTCREIRDKTLLRFGSQYFKRVCIDIIPGCFRRLAWISEHHQFRLRVRRLDLGTLHLYQWFAPRPPEAGNPFIEEDFELVQRCRCPVGPRLPVGVEKDLKSLIASAHDEQEALGFPAFPIRGYSDDVPGYLEPTMDRFFDEDEFTRWLLACIGRLPNLEHIAIHQSNMPSMLPGPGTSQKIARARTTIVTTSLFVIQYHKVHLKGLEIMSDTPSHFPPSISLLAPVLFSPELFDKMTNLDLQLSVAKHDRLDSSFSALMEVFRSAKALLSLKLCVDEKNPRSRQVLSEMIRQKVWFPKLQFLVIVGAMLSSDSLIEFLSASKDTLRIIGLRHIVLVSGSWKHLFMSCLSELSLSYLQLDSLYDHDRRISFWRIHHERPVIDIPERILGLRPHVGQDGELLSSFQIVTRIDHIVTGHDDDDDDDDDDDVFRSNTDYFLDLTDGDGEDIRQWIFMLANNYVLS